MTAACQGKVKNCVIPVAEVMLDGEVMRFYSRRMKESAHAPLRCSGNVMIPDLVLSGRISGHIRLWWEMHCTAPSGS